VEEQEGGEALCFSFFMLGTVQYEIQGCDRVICQAGLCLGPRVELCTLSPTNNLCGPGQGVDPGAGDMGLGAT
jgi:hypothetical protein